MKRTFTLALTAVLGSMMATQAFAQEAFPDTPENHWAYEALAKMRAAGLLVGYPDGLYRGGRPASRYEMAVALYALYQHLKGITDGLDARIKALEDRPETDLTELRRSLEALRADMAGMKAWGDDIANLKRMAATFEKELASMGVDIEALKKGLADLADRVSALEKRKPAVDIHGNVAMSILGGYGDDGFYGISVDGRPFGVDRGTGGVTGDFTDDLSVFHAGDIMFTGTNDTGPKWKAALSVNNLLGSASFGDGSSGGFGIGNTSQTFSGVPFFDGNHTDVYFNEFEISDRTQFLGQSFGYRVGRIGMKVSPYILQRPDNSPYIKNERLDDGRWYFDGLDLAFGLGRASLNVFGGRVSDRLTTNGVDINPMWAGGYGHMFEPGGTTGNNPERPRGLAGGVLHIDRMLGTALNIPLSERGSLNLAYLLLDSDSITSVSGSSIGPFADRVAVFGGDVKFGIGGLDLMAGYSQTNLMLGDTTVVDEDNSAWHVSAGRRWDNWGFKVGYRSIDPQFYAPGDWGRIGIWWNPTDIQGFFGSVNFNINDRLMIGGKAGFYEGRDEVVNGAAGLSDDDEIMHWSLDLMYKISDNTELWLGTEQVNWDLAARAAPNEGGFAGGEVDEIWYNIGVRHMMNDRSWFSIRWQISDYDANGTAGMNPFPSFFSSSDRAKGGVITSTLSIKF